MYKSDQFLISVLNKSKYSYCCLEEVKNIQHKLFDFTDDIQQEAAYTRECSIETFYQTEQKSSCTIFTC